MEKSHKPEFLYCFINTDQNKIRSEGLKHIPNAKINNLQILFLGNYSNNSDSNPIGSRGVKLLVKANLQQL